MARYKCGGRKVKNRKQAIAIGLSKARRKGAKIPSTNDIYFNRAINK